MYKLEDLKQISSLGDFTAMLERSGRYTRSRFTISCLEYAGTYWEGFTLRRLKLLPAGWKIIWIGSSSLALEVSGEEFTACCTAACK